MTSSMRDQRDVALENAILELLDERSSGATICPSEAARRVAGDGEWRPLMDAARAAAARLIASGKVEVTQQGKRVDLAFARGPIRLRRTND
jgi:hypothetical protein